jgi:hypothetical protein
MQLDEIYKQLTFLQRQLDNLVKPEIITISELSDLFLLRANNLSDVNSALTSFNNIKQAATTAFSGVSELATDAEAQTLSSTTVVLTPSNLASLLALPVNGRLTLTTGTPVLTGDVTGATTIYFTPFLGNRISLYNGSIWLPYSFSEISIAVPSTVFRLFDIFIYDNAGTVTLQTVNWNQSTAAITNATNATPIVVTSNGHGLANNDLVAIAGVNGNTAANGIWSVQNVAANTFELEGSAGSGAYTNGGTWYKLNATRATAITLQNGRYVKSGDTGKLYLGTGMTTGASGQTEVKLTAPSNVLLFNYFNRVLMPLAVVDNTSHTYTSATARIYRNQNANKVGFLAGIVEDAVLTSLRADFNFDSGDGNVSTGFSRNRTGNLATFVTTVRDVFDARGLFDGAGIIPDTGYNFLQLVQTGAATSPDFLAVSGRATVKG